MCHIFDGKCGQLLILFYVSHVRSKYLCKQAVTKGHTQTFWGYVWQDVLSRHARDLRMTPALLFHSLIKLCFSLQQLQVVTTFVITVPTHISIVLNNLSLYCVKLTSTRTYHILEYTQVLTVRAWFRFMVIYAHIPHPALTHKSPHPSSFL